MAPQNAAGTGPAWRNDLTRLPILSLCLILSSALAAQTLPVEQRPMPGIPAAGDSQKFFGDRAAMELPGEWWQLTASLTDGDGRPWALEWSLHRQPGPRGAGDTRPSASMSLTHVSITTPDGIQHEQRFASRDTSAAGSAALAGKADYDAHRQGWEWVSQGEALLPARLSFSIGERDINLLLQTVGEQDSSTADGSGGEPVVRVRGFVDRGASKTYLRGLGRLDREWHSFAQAGKPSAADRAVTRKASSPAE